MRVLGTKGKANISASQEHVNLQILQRSRTTGQGTVRISDEEIDELFLYGNSVLNNNEAFPFKNHLGTFLSVLNAYK